MAHAFHPLSDRPSAREYVAVAAIVAGGVALIVAATRAPAAAADVRELVLPLVAMFGVTAVVWMLMVLFRNGAVFFGAASLRYFRDYQAKAPQEWIERPTRAFNNLMQAPTLFYVVALLMIALHNVDASQVLLAWIYVASRTLHAVIHIGFNYVPFRFAVYAVSCITLAVMWARLALSV
jgi:hypothetical protein